ncbi:MAG: prolipoprotein diacylglyceryl transferase [Candidatus Rhabdochlamydia sp.]
MFAYVNWDPSPEVFSWKLPILDRPLLWYGVFFTLGIILAHQMLLTLVYRNNQKARGEMEALVTYLLVGIILGARLFDLLFYQGFAALMSHPLKIFYLWEGGLSSHGGVLGLIIGVLLYQRRYPSFSLLARLDHLSIVAGLPAACIRIGNFFNQEILGTLTTMPWGVVFGHPIDGSLPAARHPVQLYEAFFYLACVAVMIWLYHLKIIRKEGVLCGLFVTAIFSFRFLIEYFKEEQSSFFQHHLFTMGQLLSLPFIVLGIVLMSQKYWTTYIKTLLAFNKHP